MLEFIIRRPPAGAKKKRRQFVCQILTYRLDDEKRYAAEVIPGVYVTRDHVYMGDRLQEEVTKFLAELDRAEFPQVKPA